MSNSMNIFHGTKNGLRTFNDAALQHLTVSNKALLQCTTLTASQQVTSSGLQCQSAVIGDLTISGDLFVQGAVEICTILCPQDFTLDANRNILLNAGTGVGSHGPLASGEILITAGGTAIGNGTNQVIIEAGNSVVGTLTGTGEMALLAENGLAAISFNGDLLARSVLADVRISGRDAGSVVQLESLGAAVDSIDLLTAAGGIQMSAGRGISATATDSGITLASIGAPAAGADISATTSNGDIMLSAVGSGAIGTSTFGSITLSATADTFLGSSADISLGTTLGNIELTPTGSATSKKSIILNTRNPHTDIEVEVGLVTQLNSIETAVELNSVSGIITLATDSIAQDAAATFILTNSKIAATSLIMLTMEADWQQFGPNRSRPSINLKVVGAGTCSIQINNVGGATTGTEALGKVHFLVLNPVPP